MIHDSADPQFSQDRITARLEIQHRVLQFVHGVDRRDMDLARQAFHEDAIDDHGAFNGPVAEMFEWIEHRHRNIAVSHHHIGNQYIEFSDDDNAFSEAYVLVWQSVNPQVSILATESDEAYESFGASRYIDHFTRRNGYWRVQRRVCVPTANQRFEATSMEYPPSWPRHTRNDADPAQALRRELGLIPTGGPDDGGSADTSPNRLLCLACSVGGREERNA